MAECKSDEETFAHLLFPIGHILESLLFIVDFLILGHISFVGEIVEVPGIGLRV